MATLAPAAAASAGLDPSRLAAACREAARRLAASDEPAAAVESALAALDLEGTFVSLFVLEHERLWMVAQRGYALVPDGLGAGAGVMGRAVRLRRAQLVQDVHADPDYVPVLDAVVSELAVPLQLDGRVVGVFDLESTRPLPCDAARLVRPLARGLAPVAEALRSARRLDLSALARLFVHISSLRDPAAISEIAAGSLARVLPVETSQVVLFRDDGSAEELACWRTARMSVEPFELVELLRLRDVAGAAAVVELLPSPARDGSPRHAVWLPLRASGVEIGVLAGSSRTGEQPDQAQAEVAALLAAHVAASLDAAVSLDRERVNALTDPLTGLLNRRGFEERLECELEAAQGLRRPLSVLVLDCDDFKAVNDRAGHEFGDALLREVGRQLSELLPPTAASARLGGDEFVVLLPDTDVETAKALGDRLRADLTERLADAGFPLHVSGGFAAYPFDGASASQLLRGADQALYAAKALGKDRVIGIRDALYGSEQERTGSAAAAAAERRRTRRGEGSTQLCELADAADALWQEQTHAGVLERLCKALTFVVGATGCLASRVEGDYLYDAARHALRDIDLGDDAAYLIQDFPLTHEALRTGESRSISFLDPDIDRAEAFVLRDLGMSCVLLLPLRVDGDPWALVELYDVRLRHFSDAERATAEFLVRQAARRIETITATTQARAPSLPVVRVPGRGSEPGDGSAQPSGGTGSR